MVSEAELSNASASGQTRSEEPPLVRRALSNTSSEGTIPVSECKQSAPEAEASAQATEGPSESRVDVVHTIPQSCSQLGDDAEMEDQTDLPARWGTSEPIESQMDTTEDPTNAPVVGETTNRGSAKPERYVTSFDEPRSLTIPSGADGKRQKKQPTRHGKCVVTGPCSIPWEQREFKLTVAAGEHSLFDFLKELKDKGLKKFGRTATASLDDTVKRARITLKAGHAEASVIEAWETTLRPAGHLSLWDRIVRVPESCSENELKYQVDVQLLDCEDREVRKAMNFQFVIRREARQLDLKMDDDTLNTHTDAHGEEEPGPSSDNSLFDPMEDAFGSGYSLSAAFNVPLVPRSRRPAASSATSTCSDALSDAPTEMLQSKRPRLEEPPESGNDTKTPPDRVFQVPSFETTLAAVRHDPYNWPADVDVRASVPAYRDQTPNAAGAHDKSPEFQTFCREELGPIHENQRHEGGYTEALKKFCDRSFGAGLFPARDSRQIPVVQAMLKELVSILEARGETVDKYGSDGVGGDIDAAYQKLELMVTFRRLWQATTTDERKLANEAGKEKENELKAASAAKKAAKKAGTTAEAVAPAPLPASVATAASSSTVVPTSANTAVVSAAATATATAALIGSTNVSEATPPPMVPPQPPMAPPPPLSSADNQTEPDQWTTLVMDVARRHPGDILALRNEVMRLQPDVAKNMLLRHARICKARKTTRGCSTCSKLRERVLSIRAAKTARRAHLWGKLRTHWLVVRWLCKAQREAAERVFAPGGTGFLAAKANFTSKKRELAVTASESVKRQRLEEQQTQQDTIEELKDLDFGHTKVGNRVGSDGMMALCEAITFDVM